MLKLVVVNQPVFPFKLKWKISSSVFQKMFDDEAVLLFSSVINHRHSWRNTVVVLIADAPSLFTGNVFINILHSGEGRHTVVPAVH